jgi:long-subunit acyl-CoA synthetase (AMP-forming)
VQVETLIKIHPMVENICVYGDPGRIHTVALLVPDQTMLQELANKVTSFLMIVSRDLESQFP